MSNLRPCMDCRQMISASAMPCPKCASNEPYGTACLICRQYLRRSDGISLPVSQDRVYHQQCLEQLFTISSDLECPDCHVRYPAGSFHYWTLVHPDYQRQLICQSCGCPTLLFSPKPGWGRQSCEYCKLPIWNKFQSSTEFGPEVRGECDLTYYAHGVCRQAYLRDHPPSWARPTTAPAKGTGCILCVGTLLTALAFFRVCIHHQTPNHALQRTEAGGTSVLHP